MLTYNHSKQNLFKNLFIIKHLFITLFKRFIKLNKINLANKLNEKKRIKHKR